MLLPNTKEEVNAMIMDAVESLYKEKTDEFRPFFMSDVQKKILDKHRNTIDCYWTDRMQRHCFRLQKAGKLFLLKKGGRYFLSLPDREILPGYEIITSDTLPDHRLKKRKAIFAQIASAVDELTFLSVYHEEMNAISGIVWSSEDGHKKKDSIIKSMIPVKSKIVKQHMNMISAINVNNIYLGNDEYIFDKIVAEIRWYKKDEIGSVQ